MRAERRGAAEPLLRVQLRSRVGTARVGMAVSRRVGGAVVRNRVRRRLRAAASKRIARWEGLDVVVIPSALAAEAKFAELAEQLYRAVDRAQSR